MSELSVRIEVLPPMRVASIRAFSATPERDAWEKLQVWAEGRGLFDNPQAHPVFGFNNPSPTGGSKLYGYEYWIRVDFAAQSVGGIEVKDFPGGRYAVTTCRLFGDPAGTVMDVWKQLGDWATRNGHQWRHTHELERLHNSRVTGDDIVLDLYLPIEE